MTRSVPPIARDKLSYALCNGRVAPALRQGVAVGLLTLSLTASTFAAETRLAVTLFGQPCLLKGPFDQTTLKAVHAVSPEQIVSAFSSSRTAEQTRRAIERLQSAAGLPPGLDLYRDKLGTELKSQLVFLDGLEAARKAGNGSLLVAAAKPYIRAAKRKEFETLASKINGKTSVPAAVIEQLFDFYADAGESDSPTSPTAEEEFHRDIRRMGVQYACNFDIEDSTGGGESDDAEPGAPAAPKALTTPGSAPRPPAASTPAPAPVPVQ